MTKGVGWGRQGRWGVRGTLKTVDVPTSIFLGVEIRAM